MPLIHQHRHRRAVVVAGNDVQFAVVVHVAPAPEAGNFSPIARPQMSHPTPEISLSADFDRVKSVLSFVCRKRRSNKLGAGAHVQEHRLGSGSNFHSILKQKLKGVDFSNTEAVLGAVDAAYYDWKPDTGPLFATAARKWITQELSQME